MQQHKIDQTGIYIFPCGGTYVGGWYKNQESGRGTWAHPLGARYVGEFKDGKPWNGTEHDKDGNVIEEFVKGVKTQE